MKKEKKTLLLLLSIVIIFIAVIIISKNSVKEDNDSIQKWRDKNIGNIQFKGKVVESKIVEHGGRRYGIVCLDLDYSNTKDFYVFNEFACLRIKDGKAIMSIGFVMQNDEKVKYIEVNIKGDKKERFFKEGGGVDEYEMTLASNGILKEDMKNCD